MPASALIEGKSSMDYDREDMRRLFDAGKAAFAVPDPWIHDPCHLPNVMHYGTSAVGDNCSRGNS
jgi:hypothetical protein